MHYEMNVFMPSFALTTSLLLSLFFGMIEMHYTRIHYKLAEILQIKENFCK